MRVRGLTRIGASVIVMMLFLPTLYSPPSSAGSVLSQSVADFSKGLANNTTVWPDGMVLSPNGSGPNEWTFIGNCSPGFELYPGFCYDDVHGFFVMIDLDMYSNPVATWKYDVKTDIWTVINASSMSFPFIKIQQGVLDKSLHKMIFVDYMDRSTYTYDLVSGAWKWMNPSTSPNVGHGCAMAFDDDTGEMLAFGGVNPNTRKYYNETWSYNLSNNVWTNRTPSGSPSARTSTSMVYDSANKVMVLFGGNASDYITPAGETLFTDTWTYDPGTNCWANCSPPVSPPGRKGFAMVYYPPAGETVLYGGSQAKRILLEPTPGPTI